MFVFKESLPVNTFLWSEGLGLRYRKETGCPPWRREHSASYTAEVYQSNHFSLSKPSLNQIHSRGGGKQKLFRKVKAERETILADGLRQREPSWCTFTEKRVFTER